MNVLIIDNYDSFTGNLCQLIAGVTGQVPLTIKNDALTLAQILDLDVDAIILSPGPGTPGCAEDFGVCADVIRHADIPILGVCLGFQGIANVFGATVRRARCPLHGEQSEVRHSAHDLFEGMPNPLHVVRYHSLEVMLTPSAPLDVLATATDGTLMAVRHRDKPIWGVQFHPESIGTEGGDTLVRNFLAMARDALPGTPEMSQPGVSAAPGPGGERVQTHTACWRRLDRWHDPADCFAHLYGSASHAFWLDSSLVASGRSRFSFMGQPAHSPGAVLRYNAQDRIVNLASADGTGDENRSSTLFDFFDEMSLACAVDDELPFDFLGGWVGYLGYEARADSGHDVRHASASPDAQFMFVDSFIAFDHEDAHLYVVTVAPCDQRGEAERRVDQLAADLASVPDGAVDGFRGATTAASVPEYVMTRPDYVARVNACQELIREGQSYEICLTMNAACTSDSDPLAFYLSLRERNAAPYAAFFRVGDYAIACSSPERFLRIDRHRWVESKPIKGTAPRGESPAEDKVIRDALFNSTKNRAENLMIVDLLRNDLSYTCDVGSVHVPRLMDIESYQTVHQMVSTIRGRLRPDANAVECLRHTFPGGSMTGAPKIRTMQLLNELETEARGAYSGTLGYISLNGCADLNIVIRSAVFDGARVSVGMGGAVTLLSDPDEEYDEAMLKGDVVLRAMHTHARNTRDR